MGVSVRIELYSNTIPAPTTVRTVLWMQRRTPPAVPHNDIKRQHSRDGDGWLGARNQQKPVQLVAKSQEWESQLKGSYFSTNQYQ
jgi:hypothetical protein